MELNVAQSPKLQVLRLMSSQNQIYKPPIPFGQGGYISIQKCPPAKTLKTDAADILIDILIAWYKR